MGQRPGRTTRVDAAPSAPLRPGAFMVPMCSFVAIGSFSVTL